MFPSLHAEASVLSQILKTFFLVFYKDRALRLIRHLPALVLSLRTRHVPHIKKGEKLSTKPPSDFIRAIINEDLRINKNDGKVHHVAVSVNGTFIKAYVDNQRVVNDPDGIVRPIKHTGIMFLQTTAIQIQYVYKFQARRRGERH
jgi:hypothetical protein